LLGRDFICSLLAKFSQMAPTWRDFYTVVRGARLDAA
jgi:hypothetical protein